MGFLQAIRNYCSGCLSNAVHVLLQAANMWSPCSPASAGVRSCASVTAGSAAAIEPTWPAPVCWSWQAACTLMSSSRSACNMQRCWLPLWLAALQCLRQILPSVLDLHAASAKPQRQPGSMQCVLCPGPQSAASAAVVACRLAGDPLRRDHLAHAGSRGCCCLLGCR